MRKLLFVLVSVGAISLFSSCANMTGSGRENPSLVNPYPKGTIEHFQAEREYLYTYNSWMNRKAYELAQPSETSITICISSQRGFLKKGDHILIDYPISSGKENYETPLGTYKILEKKADKRSNVYGKIYDEYGDLLNPDVDIREYELQPGEKFEGADMPYWMRMTWDGVGHHVGLTPRHPSSHACVRGHHQIMPLVFEKVQTGTLIHVIE